MSTTFVFTLKPGGGMGWPRGAEYTGAVASEPDTKPIDEDEPAVEVDEERPDPEREARKLVALAQVRQYPDPVLRMRAREVESFDDELAQLVQRLTAIMEGADGAGLAATQVGVLRRVFVMRASEGGETVALVNPELVASGEELELDEEGCLSLQGLLVPVERAATVTLTAKDPTGAAVTLELEGFAARAAQHELDHLDGVLMIDRTTDDARREAMALLRRGSVAAARL
jgi:peptide deformylase